MIIIAGAPGSGKSAAFPASTFGVDFFNADDRAAELNEGLYVRIPQEIRARVNREFESVVRDHIRDRRSFAIETTLRSSITFEQARDAKAAGFATEMRYLALESIELNLERVKSRSDKGGHSASERVLRAIHKASLLNLARAIAEIDLVRVYDNSTFGKSPELVLETNGGRVITEGRPAPAWLTLP